MRTRVSQIADQILEATVLVAVVTVPLVFNFYSVRVFAGEKAALLRALALVAAVAWLMRTLENGDLRAGLVRIRKDPLVLAALAVGLVTLLAGFVSVAPRLSLWGSYQRVQGVFTTLAYLVLFFAVLTTVRTPARRQRLVRVLLAASVPVTLYALAQYFGLDPLPWVREEASRVFSTLTNPIFLGAYLVLLIPLTLAQLLRSLRARGGAAWKATAYGLLLLLQLLALVFSGSRGPFLGLGAALFFFALSVALLSGRRQVALGLVGLSVAGVLLLAGVSLSPKLQALARPVPLLGRFATPEADGSAQVRVLIWESVVARLAEEPQRLLLGFGPETTYVALLPTTRPALHHLERGERLADRAHNLVFETLVTTGVVGTLAWVLLFAVLFWTAFRALGLTERAAARSVWGLLTALGVILGAALPRLLVGTWTYSGLGVALGLAAAPVLYVLWVAWRPTGGSASRLDAGALLIVALASALLGHLVERSVGIGVTATLTVFWVLAGLLGAAVGTATPAAREEGGALRSLAAESVLVGLMLVTLAFGLLPLEPLPGASLGRWVVLGGTWLLCGWLVLGGAAFPSERGGRGLASPLEQRWDLPRLARAVGGYAAGSLGWFAPFLGLRWLALALGGDALTLLNLYGLWVLLSVFVVALFLPTTLAAQPAADASRRLATPFALMYPALWAIALALIALQVLPPLRADVFLRAAQANADAGRWNVALPLYQRAAQEAPQEEEFLRRLAEAYASAAQLVAPAQRDAFFDAGRRALERALTLDPQNAVQRFNLAHLYLLWAQATSDPARRGRLLQQASALYAQAAQAMPGDPRVLDEWGLVLVAQGDEDAALTRFRQALTIDPQDAQAYFHLGGLYRARGKADLALQAYQRAVQLDPEFAAAYRAMADLYREQGDLARAVAAQEQAAALQPTDFAVHQNLALLYRDMGEFDRALTEARLALRYAPAERQAALQRFIQELEGKVRD